jgi:hypothetical protein|tara:strand:- start:2242 stop:2589 length:348 start_codon:yes stop_codon:yes gene_type:complete
MRVLIIVLTMLLVTACSGVNRIETVSVAVAKTPLNLNLPKPLTANDVEWIVINKDNYQEVFDKLTADGKQPVLFALTDKGYQALALNYADIRKVIAEQRQILISYQEYYEPQPSE